MNGMPPARTLRIKAEVQVSSQVFDLPVRLLAALKYIDPTRIATDRLEFATAEFAGHLYILTATISRGQVIGVDISGEYARPLSDGSLFCPLTRAAFKHDNIDIDGLSDTPISIEEFVNGLTTSLDFTPQPRPREMGELCWVTVRVIDFGDDNVLVCFYVCGRWAGCVHIAPDK